jgi:hypothetical protein
MGYKMKMGKLSIDNTPIYQIDTEEGIMGQANMNGSIVVDKNLSPLEQEDVIKHEKVHLDQMKRGDLEYNDDNVTWKGKKYSRASMKEGSKKLPWEVEAYKANKLKT